MRAAPRLLVVQHEDECPPGWFDGWLTDAGVELDVVAGHRGDDVPSRVRGIDALLVLGGQMSANDGAAHPWLAPTMDLVADAVDQGRPFLGICLGHQLATVALGGVVGRNPEGTTRGVVPVALTEPGRADELLGGHDGDPSVHWNGDVATRLPGGATVLATTPDGYPQAVRFGARAWGVQFHPEASPEIVGGWVVERPAHPVPAKVTEACDAVRAAEARLRSTWQPFARCFARLLTA